MMFHLRHLTPSDVQTVMAARDLFDAPPDLAATTEFLKRANHHIIMAFTDDRAAVGFVTGIEMIHPDKQDEMFLYELGVADHMRRHGIGRALVSALGQFARDRGCRGMWGLTDHDNRAAIATYQSAGSTRPASHVLVEWGYRDR